MKIFAKPLHLKYLTISHVNHPPLKIGFFNFQWTPIIIKFFILNPSHLLKVTKFLVRIPQFKFLVMTEKNFFCRWVFQILVYFLCFYVKTGTPPEKKIPSSFPATPPPPLPPQKLRSCQSSPLWKFGRRLNPPAERGWGGVHTMDSMSSSACVLD